MKIPVKTIEEIIIDLDYFYERLEKLEIRIQKLEEKERNSEIKEKQN